MKKEILKTVMLASLLGSAWISSGCAGLKPVFDADRAKGVKRLAIVSIEVLQDQPKDSFGFSKMNELKNGAAADQPAAQAMMEATYNDLVAEIGSKSKWKVMDLATLKANKFYAEKVQKAMTGARQVTMRPANSDIISLHGVLDQTAFRKMSDAEKAHLAKELGVDAIAEYQAIQVIEQGYSFGNLTGNAPFQFTTRSNLIVFGPNSDKPIWRIQNVDGKQSVSSETLPEKMPKLERLAKIGQIANKSSIETMVSRYGEGEAIR